MFHRNEDIPWLHGARGIRMSIGVVIRQGGGYHFPQGGISTHTSYGHVNKLGPAVIDHDGPVQ